ncbi:MAG: KamA family radical SAM protein [bacterium]|nr:MAG: KamA family radical SAM protein [bacterium]
MESIHTIEQLKQNLRITPEEERILRKIVQKHPMRITRSYIDLIDRHDPKDPIRKMVVPTIEELNLAGEYDTSGEGENTKLPGLQHKYTQTALILATNRCATYCRYCFRKRMVGLPTDEILERFSEAVAYIREHKEINNVLVSGGDPFVLPTEVIEQFMKELSTIPHLDYIRFGTRIPIMSPGRIIEDERLQSLLERYSGSNQRVYIITQVNHPRELAARPIEAFDTLLKCKMIINNQSILLRGVNDNPRTLARLQRKLVNTGVNPYYIFQCRPVKSVKAHFQVPLIQGYKIIEDTKKMLDGHSKRFKYVMSHWTGKVEIMGVMDGYMYFKYHQAKDLRNAGRFFKRKLNNTACWLDDMEPVSH